MVRTLCLMIAAAVALLSAAAPGWAEEGATHHIAVNGRPEATGTADDPWDIGALANPHDVIQPGDTVYLHGGTYRHPDRSVGSEGFSVRLAGTPDRPIHVRPRPGDRVTIDGALRVLEGSDYLWIWELELIVSENFTESRRIEEPGSHPGSLNRPWGGLHVFGGDQCKFINLVIHDTAQGVSWWRGSTNSEIHGAIIYDNGWDAPDRGHGHAIYTQNETGVKRITDCIMTGGYGQTMHAYGSSRAYVDHYHIEGNIAYDGNRFLVGGGRPSRDITVTGNLLHNVPMQLGYNAPHNEDVVVTDNVIIGGGLSIVDFREVRQQNNRVVGNPAALDDDQRVMTFVRPNQYDPARAHIAIWNFTDADDVAVDLADVLDPGDAFRLMDPTDFYGEPVYRGTFEGEPLELPAKADFTVYVLLREA